MIIYLFSDSMQLKIYPFFRNRCWRKLRNQKLIKAIRINRFDLYQNYQVLYARTNKVENLKQRFRFVIFCTILACCLLGKQRK